MVILEDYVSFTTQFSEAICFHAFSLKHKSQKQIYSEKYKNQLLRSLFFFYTIFISFFFIGTLSSRQKIIILRADQNLFIL